MCSGFDVCDVTCLPYFPVQIGVLLTMPVGSPASFRQRGHMLTAVEYSVAAYRMLPPAPLWFNWFNVAALNSFLGTGLSGASACEHRSAKLPAQVCFSKYSLIAPFAGAYLLIKAQQTLERAALAVTAVKQVAVRGYGSTPTSEEVQEAGNSCPICQVCCVASRLQVLCCLHHLYSGSVSDSCV